MFGLKDGEFSRLREIANALFRQGMGHAVERMQLKQLLSFHRRLHKEDFGRPITSLPVRLRKTFEELGGSFVKLGQMLSLRYDLLPKEYCDEFAKLQDNVAPFPFDEVKKVLERELGAPVSKIFKEFEKKPLAAASVGQVHKARLLNGEIVAVKVQRPGIAEKFSGDVALLYHLAKIIHSRYPETRDFDFKAMISEFEIYTKKEMDYMLEARNIEIFHNNFKDNASVSIPKVNWKHTTGKVLTMSYIYGVKISEVQDFKKHHSDMKKTTDTVLNAMMKQIFDDRTFHADPHPGNILLTGYNKIAILDFGIVGRLLPELIDEMEDVLIGLIQQDLDTVINAFLKLGMVDAASIDVKEFKEDVIERFAEYYGATLEQINFATFFTHMFDMARKYKIVLPLNFTLLAKSLITLQGYCAKYAPDFNLATYIEPKVREMMKERSQPRYILNSVRRATNTMRDFVKSFPEDFASLVRTIKKGPKLSLEWNTEDIRKFTIELDRSSNRLSFAMVMAAMIVATSIVLHAKIPPFIYGIPVLAYLGFFVILLLTLMLIVSISREGKNNGGE